MLASAIKNRYELSPIAEEAFFSFPLPAEHGNASEIPGEGSNCRRDGANSSMQQIDCHQQTPWVAVLENGDTGSMAMQLLRDNWCLLKYLHLDDWVQHAVGAPSAAITMFQTYHGRLSLSLFCYLCRFPAEIEKCTSTARVGKGQSWLGPLANFGYPAEPPA